VILHVLRVSEGKEREREREIEREREREIQYRRYVRKRFSTLTLI